MTHLLPHSLCFTRISIAPATYFQTPNFNPFRLQSFGSFTTRCTDQFRLKVHESECDVKKRVLSSDLNFDSLLSAMELSCLASSAIFSVVLATNGSKNWLMMVSGGNAVWGILMLAGGVAAGALIRRRQWKRISRESMKGRLMERVEKLEEDLRKMVRVIRILSRHVEKLGKRFQVTRYALKEPITQSATVAQKNSEATRAIAVQSEFLEKELREIQKVLLAIQEQQQKQLDLILSLNPWESKRKTPKEQHTLKIASSAEDEVRHVETTKSEVWVEVWEENS